MTYLHSQSTPLEVNVVFVAYQRLLDTVATTD